MVSSYARTCAENSGTNPRSTMALRAILMSCSRCFPAVSSATVASVGVEYYDLLTVAQMIASRLINNPLK
jgi:hypothetical protein